MEQAYFQALPFSGRVRPTPARKSIPTHPRCPVHLEIRFGLSPRDATKKNKKQTKKLCPALKGFIISSGDFKRECATWKQVYRWLPLESRRTECPTASSCLQGQSSSEGRSQICWFVKYNQDISMLSLSCSLEFRDVLNSVLDLPCFDVPRRGRWLEQRK